MKKTYFNHWTGLYDQFESIKIEKHINIEGEIEHVIILNLINCSHTEQYKKSQLTFTGVRAFKLGNIDWPSVIQISVTDISHDQMEGIRYSVREDENNLFFFYCKSFSYKEG